MFSKGPWCKNINCQVSAFTCFKTLMFCTILWLTLGLFQPAIQIHGLISYVQPFWWVSTEALLRENSCWIIWNYFVLKQPISPMFSVAEIVQYLLEFSESWSFNPHVSADDKINNARHCIVFYQCENFHVYISREMTNCANYQQQCLPMLWENGMQGSSFISLDG